MEMPEKWKYFKKRLANRHGLSMYDSEKLLDLMKEMAEALEYLRKRDLSNGIVGQELGAWQILNKFKEWK